jgi:hypothetical protein
MSDNRRLNNNYNTTDYVSLCAAINYEYCEKHGYDFIYFRPYFKNKDKIELNNCVNPESKAPRHASWSKLITTQIALKGDYDYVIYVDSDCIFKDFNKRIESYIHDPSTNLIFWLNKPYTPDPCAGFYIAKVNAATKKIFREWYEINLPEYDTKHDWEQAALVTFYKKHNIAIINELMFLEEEGQFLRHIGSGFGGEAQRIPYFKKYVEENHISFTKNIDTINLNNYMEYDTSIIYDNDSGFFTTSI